MTIDMTTNLRLNPLVPPERSERVLADTRSWLYERIRELTPVLTGRMKRSWDVSISTGGEVSISNNTPYAGYVDGGTRKMRARNVTGDALSRLQETYDEIAGAVVGADQARLRASARLSSSPYSAEALALARQIYGGVSPVPGEGLFDFGQRTLRRGDRSPREPLPVGTTLAEEYGITGQLYGDGLALGSPSAASEYASQVATLLGGYGR